MHIPTKTLLAAAVAIVISPSAQAEFELTGYLKNETSLYRKDGPITGEPEGSIHSAGDLLKSEFTAKGFINGDISDNASLHAEINLIYDTEGVNNDLKGHNDYTQHDYLRELYVDTSLGGWDFRIGKQQVVWGTADGIKLLDIINPTDFRELVQNSFEESRIPLWMINTETNVGENGNFQFLISEAQPNFILGLGPNGGDDAGAPFIFKGVDTITGGVNGFLNIARDMGKTSGVFQTLLGMGGLTSLNQGPMALTTVSGFTSLGSADNPTFSDVGNLLTGPGGAGPGGLTIFPGPVTDPTNQALLSAVFLPFMNKLQTGNVVLDQAANSSGDLINNFAAYMGQLQGAFANGVGIDFDEDGTEDLDNATIGAALQALGAQMTLNVAQGLGVAIPNPANLADPANQQALGELATKLNVDPTDQAAFNAAIQTAAIDGLKNSFFSNSTTNQFDGEISTDNPTSAFDYMGNTTFATFDAFIGMRTVYRRNYDTNALSNGNLAFRFKNSTAGGTNYSLNYAYHFDNNPYVELHWEDKNGDELTVNKQTTSLDALGQPREDATGASNGNPNPEAAKVTTLYMTDKDGNVFSSQNGANPATLVFEEKLNRISTIGASFDTAIDSASVPVVIRGEFSYDVGAKQPVIDRNELSIGNLTGALKMEDADMFKYVLGVDVTVLTNLMVSTQLIQFFNLDYIDSNNRYTADFSTMHLTNGLNKGDEVETFVSLFLSKPFGSSQEHRWNNILIAENGGGYWDRLDLEYSFSDFLIGTAEFNSYFGDENTQFGQFKNSSNLQLGLKYLFQ